MGLFEYFSVDGTVGVSHVAGCAMVKASFLLAENLFDVIPVLVVENFRLG